MGCQFKFPERENKKKLFDTGKLPQHKTKHNITKILQMYNFDGNLTTTKIIYLIDMVMPIFVLYNSNQQIKKINVLFIWRSNNKIQ